MVLYQVSSVPESLLMGYRLRPHERTTGLPSILRQLRDWTRLRFAQNWCFILSGAGPGGCRSIQ